MEDIASKLDARCPGRLAQIRSLVGLLRPEPPSPPALLLHDPHSPSTTTRLAHELLALSSGTENASHPTDPLLPSLHPSCRAVSISPLTAPSARILFETILRGLSPPSASFPTHAQTRTDDSLDAFLAGLRALMQSPVAQASASSIAVSAARQEVGKVCILIERAERIRDVWPEHVGEALLKLGDLVAAPGRITVIMVSTLPWSHFRTPRGAEIALAPLTIKFPKLRKEHTLAHMSLDFQRLSQSFQSDTLHPVTSATLQRLHTAFCSLFYDTAASHVRDVDEMRMLACAVWHVFALPVEHGEMAPTRTQQLLVRASPYFRDALHRLHTREVGPKEWISHARTKALAAINAKNSAHDPMGDEQMEDEDHMETDSTEEVTRKKRNRATAPDPDAMSHLPLYAQYLLLASFLASYNPTRLDVRYFLRDDALMGSSHGRRPDGARRRRPVKRRKTADGEQGEGQSLNRQQLLGPKPFPLDRMLSIFQALIIEAGPDASGAFASSRSNRSNAGTSNRDSIAISIEWERKARSAGVYAQVNTLLSRRLLSRTSGASDKLDGINLRSNVTYETVQRIAKLLGFAIEEWLWDWAP